MKFLIVFTFVLAIPQTALARLSESNSVLENSTREAAVPYQSLGAMSPQEWMQYCMRVVGSVEVCAGAVKLSDATDVEDAFRRCMRLAQSIDLCAGAVKQIFISANRTNPSVLGQHQSLKNCYETQHSLTMVQCANDHVATLLGTWGFNYTSTASLGPLPTTDAIGTR